MESLVLIDGNSLINRAFYALPPLNNKDGVPTQAVYGFATMLIRAITDLNPTYMAVAFDLKAPTFRHKKYDGYKATRKGMPEELAVQMPILKEMLKIMGITILEKEGFEADDIIGAMAKNSGVKTYIITGDRDALQLIDDKITVVLTKRGVTETVNLDITGLKAEFNLTPSQIIDYKALCGDSSDNIPGVPGVGDKTAKTLLEKYQTLDNVYLNIEEITGKLKERLQENKDLAYLSYDLATIVCDIDNLPNVKECGYVYPFVGNVKRFFIDNGFKSLVKRDNIFLESENDAKEMLSENKKKEVEQISIKTLDELNSVLNLAITSFAFFYSNNINFALDDSKEYTVFIKETLLDEGIELQDAINCFSKVLSNKDIQKYVYDAKALKHVLDKFKIEVCAYQDIKLMQYLIDMSVELDNYNKVLEEYGIADTEKATGLLYLYQLLDKELQKHNMQKLYSDVELKLIEVLYSMEHTGFCLDKSVLSGLGQDFTKRQQKLGQEIHEIAGQEFNINSPKQLGKVLFEDMQLEYPKKNPKSYSTSAEILEQIEDKSPIIRKVLDYRFLSKMNSTYVDGLIKLADSDSVVHTEFKQMLTTTGRLSSVEPNLQNIPIRDEDGRHLRKGFVAKNGNILISADYSQIELRLLAHFSQDKIMTKAYENGDDIHAITASEVFGVSLADVDSGMRRDAKAVNFGIIYGISEYGLAKNLNISAFKAREYIKKYFEKFPQIKAYLDSCVEKAKKTGYAETLLGRVRKIPELNSSNFNIRQFGERVAMNMPLQGSAADIIKIAMNSVYDSLKGFESRLILQVHDELIIDTVLKEQQVVKEILNDKMSGAVKLNVPLTVSIGEGKSWFEC